MGIVFVCQVVAIQYFRMSLPDQVFKIVLKCLIASLFDLGAWVAQKYLGRIFPDAGSFFLLFHTDFCHLVVTHIGEFTSAGRAVPIGYNAAGEMNIFLFISAQDAINGHNFDIVLVGGNAKMGRATERFGRVRAIGNINFGI